MLFLIGSTFWMNEDSEVLKNKLHKSKIKDESCKKFLLSWSTQSSVLMREEKKT